MITSLACWGEERGTRRNKTTHFRRFRASILFSFLLSSNQPFFLAAPLIASYFISHECGSKQSLLVNKKTSTIARPQGSSCVLPSYTSEYFCYFFPSGWKNSITQRKIIPLYQPASQPNKQPVSQPGTGTRVASVSQPLSHYRQAQHKTETDI